jgi:hypothetical protein
VRKFGKDYLSRIEKAGLIAVEDSFITTLPKELRYHYGLAEGEMIYKGVKP